MSSWGEFAAAEPDFAARVRRLFTSQKHMTLATLRRDGSPRISGTEVELDDDAGELALGMMAGSLKARDLRRDPRLALHSPTVEAPAEDPSGWLGDAKVAGRAVEVTAPRKVAAVNEGDAAESSDVTDNRDTADAPAGSHRFRIDITEVVLTQVGRPADHLVIESWHPDRGLRTQRRH